MKAEDLRAIAYDVQKGINAEKEAKKMLTAIYDECELLAKYGQFHLVIDSEENQSHKIFMPLFLKQQYANNFVTDISNRIFIDLDANGFEVVEIKFTAKYNESLNKYHCEYKIVISWDD